MKKQIDYIMDHFNFSKVQKAMEAVNWCWANTKGVPEEPDLRVCARELLEDVAKENVGVTISSGGFHASKEEDDGASYLRLEFCMERCRSYDVCESFRSQGWRAALKWVLSIAGRRTTYNDVILTSQIKEELEETE